MQSLSSLWLLCTSRHLPKLPNCLQCLRHVLRLTYQILSSSHLVPFVLCHYCRYIILLLVSRPCRPSPTVEIIFERIACYSHNRQFVVSVMRHCRCQPTSSVSPSAPRVSTTGMSFTANAVSTIAVDIPSINSKTITFCIFGSTVLGLLRHPEKHVDHACSCVSEFCEIVAVRPTSN